MTNSEFIKLFDMLRNKESKKLALVLIRRFIDGNRFNVLVNYLLYVCIGHEERKDLGIEDPAVRKIINTWREFCDYADKNQDVRQCIQAVSENK